MKRITMMERPRSMHDCGEVLHSHIELSTLHRVTILGLFSLTACDTAGTVSATGLAASNTITTSALATTALIAQLTVCVLVLALVGVIGVIGFVAVRGMQFALAIRNTEARTRPRSEEPRGALHAAGPAICFPREASTPPHRVHETLPRVKDFQPKPAWKSRQSISKSRQSILTSRTKHRASGSRQSAIRAARRMFK